MKLRTIRKSDSAGKTSRLLYPSFFLITLLFAAFPSRAQYFYKDLWSNQRLIREFNILKKEHVNTIRLKSFDEDGQPSDGFDCRKKINKDYTQSQMISKSNVTSQSLITVDYNGNGQPVKTVDETPASMSTTEYEYDAAGHLHFMRIITKGDDDSVVITETHEYVYNTAGQPVKMIRKKNDVLVATISFIIDSAGNIIEEDPSGTSSDSKFYYYYDDKDRLTDVVHYNNMAQRLLPEYMYEYNDQNLPEQMISTEEGSSNYFIWKYGYNDKGLIASEKCFSKQKELLGTIDYEYN